MVLWCANLMAGSFSRELYRGDMAVLLRGNMAFTPGSVT